MRKEFSVAAATNLIDAAAADCWQSRQCITCHTNFSYLLVRPGLKKPSPVAIDVRQQLEDLVEKTVGKKGPRWDAEVAMSGAILAQHDAATTGKLHPTTRKALNHMWTVQRADGPFNWLKCDWPPMKSDDHYGATIALIGAGSASAATAQAVAGILRLKEYLAANPPPHPITSSWCCGLRRTIRGS